MKDSHDRRDGAGKTTLVNHILDRTRPMQSGIVVNEFGEVGIDGQLIVADEKAKKNAAPRLNKYDI